MGPKKEAVGAEAPGTPTRRKAAAADAGSSGKVLVKYRTTMHHTLPFEVSPTSRDGPGTPSARGDPVRVRVKRGGRMPLGLELELVLVLRWMLEWLLEP